MRQFFRLQLIKISTPTQPPPAWGRSRFLVNEPTVPSSSWGGLGRGKILRSRKYLALALLAVTLTLLVRVAQAACGSGNLSDFCSSNFGLSGDLSAVGSPTGNSLPPDG